VNNGVIKRVSMGTVSREAISSYVGAIQVLSVTDEDAVFMEWSLVWQAARVASRSAVTRCIRRFSDR
jgi:hypothetical protein